MILYITSLPSVIWIVTSNPIIIRTMKDVFEQMKARLEDLLSNKYWEEDEDFDFNALQDEITEMESTVQEYEGYPFHGNEESLYNKVKKLIARVKEEAEFMDDDDMLDMMFPNGEDDEDEHSDVIETYSEIVPKDDDPDVAIDLDRITDSAKKRIDFKALEDAIGPYFDPDFFVYETLCHLNNNERPEIIAARTCAEVMMQGFVLDEKFIIEAVNSINDNCQVELYALKLACFLMFAYGADPMMVLANLERMLI